MSNVNGKSDVTPTESETTSTVGNFPHGSREIPTTSLVPMTKDRSVQARGRTTDMHVAGKSDRSIVPKKPANKGGMFASAESAEGRERTEENAEQLLLDRTQRRNADSETSEFVPRSRGLFGVREAARQHPR